jgi:hypothetical protein
VTAELALTKPDPTLTHDALKTMMDAALRYVQSGLLPPEVKTPQQALLLMKAGRELGVPDTYALRNIHIVKGKPTCSAELMLALVRRTYGPAAIRVAKTTNTECTVQYREQGWDGISEYCFTLEDAKQAGVTGTTTWRSYPAAMLRARCISAVARFAFPEAIAGLYTPEELGAQVTVSDDGSVESFITEPTRPDLKIIEGAVVEEDAPFGPEDVKPTAGTSSVRTTAPSPAADAPVASVPRKSTPARPVQQQPEPAPKEVTRARAMQDTPMTGTSRPQLIAGLATTIRAQREAGADVRMPTGEQLKGLTDDDLQKMVTDTAAALAAAEKVD